MYQGPDVQIGDNFQTNIIAELIIENSFHNLFQKAPFDFLQVSTEELVIFIEIFHVPNFNDVLNEFLLVFGKIIFYHCKYGLLYVYNHNISILGSYLTRHVTGC
jgi:hypothetical protein